MVGDITHLEQFLDLGSGDWRYRQYRGIYYFSFDTQIFDCYVRHDFLRYSASIGSSSAFLPFLIVKLSLSWSLSQFKSTVNKKDAH